MAVANFEELCRGFCDVAGIAAPRIEPNEHGTLVATLRMREVEITLMQFGAVPGISYFIAELGALPEHDPAAAWRALLEANLHVAGVHAPAFARNTDSGLPVIQWGCPLDTACAVDMLQRVDEIADVVLAWRDHRLLRRQPEALLPKARPGRCASAADDARAQSRFEGLVHAFSHVRSDGRYKTDAHPGVQAIAVRMARMDLAIRHVPACHPEHALVFARPEAPSGLPGVHEMENLMEANFALMSDSQGATFACDAQGGGPVLCFAIPLAEAVPELLVGKAAEIFRFERAFRQRPAVPVFRANVYESMA